MMDRNENLFQVDLLENLVPELKLAKLSQSISIFSTKINYQVEVKLNFP